MLYPKPTPTTFALSDSLKPLPRSAWNEHTASHLLRRIGFSATPDRVSAALKSTPLETIRNAFDNRIEFQKSDALHAFEARAHQEYQKINRELSDRDEKRRRRNDLRRENDELFREFAISWFLHARAHQNSAREKFVLFLQDVFVVGRQKVRDTPLLFRMQDTLRGALDLNFRDLCKWVSREPAMIRYLDLDKSTARKPNENFARELFELFTLGEGNYSEKDIKEAARAFTGYRVRDRYEFFFQKSLHDRKDKVVFGREGNWDGDDIIDLTFRQPASQTYLIRELFKFYLSDTPVDESYVQNLGDMWAARDFDLTSLLETFFQSRLFFHPAYRGNLVKSPIHFYIGLCQDLRIDIVPFQARLLRSIESMGQSFYNPPNVRGWLYGAHWINSTSVNARRQLVEYVFSDLEDISLNGNEQRELAMAEKQDRHKFLVTAERLAPLAQMQSREISQHLVRYFISEPLQEAYEPALAEILSDKTQTKETTLRNAVTALLQSPAYNLC